ncbi:MAG: sulfotransferase, partial [Cyanobacteria bacterium J06553_1]
MQPLPVAQPIFLVGAERSGTTLLRIMLDHHPQQAWCHEFEYAVDLLDESGGFPPL